MRAAVDAEHLRIARAATALGHDRAARRARTRARDVLLSDIGMPGEDGFDLIRAVRARTPERGGDVRAAALTAYARPEDRRRMLNAGFSRHLAKPVEPAELVAVVATPSRLLPRYADRSAP